MKKFEYAIVIGASSGIGAELVRQLAAEGTRVAAIARRGEKLQALANELGDKVLPYEHDVTNYEAVPTLFQKVTKELGGLDLVIYAAGVMPQVGHSEYDFDKDKQMIEVNLLGAIAWLDQAAIRFENTKHGSIVGIGSVAGDRGRCGVRPPGGRPRPGAGPRRLGLRQRHPPDGRRLRLRGCPGACPERGGGMTAPVTWRTDDPCPVCGTGLLITEPGDGSATRWTPWGPPRWPWATGSASRAAACGHGSRC